MKGILFKPEMIKAIVEGRKTVTRRLIKPQPKKGTIRVIQSSSPYHWQSRWIVDMRGLYPDSQPTDMIGDIHRSSYRVGEVVYIKEAIHRFNNEFATYDLDLTPVTFWQTANRFHWRWKADKLPPMFLPAEAARHFIKILDVKAGRLQKITEEDALKEGITTDSIAPPIMQYAILWDSINPKHPWSENPWVFRYEFRLVKNEQN